MNVPSTPAPDLSYRNELKRRYANLQSRFAHATAVHNDLLLELGEKQAKENSLGDEVNLVIDQIHASDYAHLEPAREDYFSASEDGEEHPIQAEESPGKDTVMTVQTGVKIRTPPGSEAPPAKRARLDAP